MWIDQYLPFVEDELQIAALSFMGIVYLLRLRWMFKKNLMMERTPPRGDAKRGATLSMLSIAMPWTMESMVKNPGRYLEFVIFHLGVTVAIAVSFIIPYWPHIIAPQNVAWALQAVVGLAFLVGVLRLARRMGRPEMRLISTMDDYFSLVVLDVWLATAFFSIPNANKHALMAFFIMTAFFLVYVPFSKISHYLYYPFARVYFGRHFGRRGVYPKVNSQA